jgi:hypothetical protein
VPSLPSDRFPIQTPCSLSPPIIKIRCTEGSFQPKVDISFWLSSFKKDHLSRKSKSRIIKPDKGIFQSCARRDSFHNHSPLEFNVLIASRVFNVKIYKAMPDNNEARIKFEAVHIPTEP